MATIQTYTAQRALQPGNTPAVSLSSAVGQEVEGLGGQVQALASAIQQRNEQKENFKAENDYRRMKMQWEEDLRIRASEAPEDGSGVYESFVTKDFKPKRDAFLSSLPERLRPQFEAILADETGADAFEWSTRAATAERDLNYDYQRREINLTSEQLAVAISMNPDAYDALLTDGRTLIEASSLPTPEKLKLKDDWERMAQTSILNKMLEDDPHGVLRELGYDTRQLSPSTQFDILARAVQWQESRDNPNAISSKGAIGLMQVMPDTARDIAAALGDENFPKDKEAIAEYLSNPYVNKLYGETYLKQQLKAFADTRNPIETALVAYNAGPSVAKKWVESGYDDKVLPKETRDYKAKILAEIAPPAGKGDPSGVKFVGADTSTVNPDLLDRTASAFAAVGLDRVKVNSGTRSREKNKAVGGAEHSQHLPGESGHGNALDIDVTGMTIPQRLELIKALSASGITGIGIGSNIIHADLGGRRAWGYATSAGGGEVPKWAQGVIAEHLAGTTPPVRNVSGRYGSLPYNVRQQFVQKADQIISQQAASAARSTAVEKVQARAARDNELALIRRTGQGDPNFDETAIATILGEDEYLKFAMDRDVALRSYTAIQGLAEMTEADMEQRLNDYNPRPGSEFEADSRVQAALRQEVDRLLRLRARSPDRAVLEIPEVKGVADALAERLEAGEATPEELQSFVEVMLSRQAELGIPLDARAPIPREWAFEIGKQLASLPRTKTFTATERAKMTPDELDRARAENRAAVYAEVRTVYEALNAQFGSYTDEVVAYALSEYRGVDKAYGAKLAAWARAVQDGTNIFREAEAAADIEKSNAVPLSILNSNPAFVAWPWLGGVGTSTATVDDGTNLEFDPDAAMRAAQEASE